MRTLVVDNRKPQPVSPPPEPEPIVADTALAKFQQFARENPPKDALEKQRYLERARLAQLADNPAPVQQDGETRAAFIRRFNENFARRGLSFRLDAGPSCATVPTAPKYNKYGVTIDPMQSR